MCRNLRSSRMFSANMAPRLSPMAVGREWWRIQGLGRVAAMGTMAGFAWGTVRADRAGRDCGLPVFGFGNRSGLRRSEHQAMCLPIQSDAMLSATHAAPTCAASHR